MLLINCPWCGPRNHAEFNYIGDATVRPPADPNAPLETWNQYVFIRDNPKGPHQEMWHHTAGCRSFVRVLRSTLTHEILATGGPNEDLARAEKGT